MMCGPSSIMGDRKRCHLGPSGIKDIVIFCSTGTSNCIEPQMGNYVKLLNPKVTDYFDALEIEQRDILFWSPVFRRQDKT